MKPYYDPNEPRQYNSDALEWKPITIHGQSIPFYITFDTKQYFMEWLANQIRIDSDRAFYNKLKEQFADNPAVLEAINMVLRMGRIGGAE